MKSKILKFIKVLIVLLYMALLGFGIHKHTPIGTDIAEGFLNQNIKSEKQLISLSKLSSQNLSVIIETNNYQENEEIKSKLNKAISKTNIKPNRINNIDLIINNYRKYPENFLTENTRNFLLKKNYNAVDMNSLRLLYNPLSIFIQTPDKDPYLFATDYVLNLQIPYLSENSTEQAGKYYSKTPFKITNTKTFNSDMKILTDFQHKINKSKTSKLYITGTPIHTYKTSKSSALEINILCLLSTFTLILLCKKYFKSLKILIPVISSILFGILTGYLVTSICVSKINVLTFVFATSLIGISLDYSIHYIYSTMQKTKVLKSITISLLTTVLSFLILCFSGIELLKQIGIFTITGLISVYIFVLIYLPIFNKFFPKNISNINFPNLWKFKNIFIGIVLFVILIGLGRLNFDDNLKNMYSPQKELLKAEMLNNKMFHIPNTTFLIIKGNNIEQILEKEEQIASKLNAKNLDYISLSKLIPSAKRQRVNKQMVSNLYDKNLKSYANFITSQSIETIKKSIKNNTVVKAENSLISEFKLDKTSSYMIVFGDSPNFNGISNVDKIDIVKSFSNILREKRLKCLNLLPIIFLIYFGVLSLCYNPKRALKIMAGPIIGAMFSVCTISTFGVPINMFHILSIFLILGFSLDYSIFMSNKEKGSIQPVFISFISSFISFMMLSFTNFKLISSMGMVLSIGLLISYIFSILLFFKDEKTNI